ncbi:hypothetical protein FACS18949_15910 [Clostridia bacterium]|nr:hypothetical protein FACS18949_15910 [Clostridia bacterium]
MRALSLFSGCGGLDLAAEASGIEIAGQCEIDADCKLVLNHWWPNTPKWRDIRDVTADDIRERAGNIDLVFGGFSCQPHSVAGLRKAAGDERDLWPEVRKILCETRPRWFVGENVPGLLTSEAGGIRGGFFGNILRDLAALGYDASWGMWGACDVGAPHRRDRVFIVAYMPRERRGARRPEQPGQRGTAGFSGGGADVAYNHGQWKQQSGGHIVQSGGRTEDGGQLGDAERGGWCGVAWRGSGTQLADGYSRLGRDVESRMGGAADGVPARLDFPCWPAGRGAEQYDYEPPRVVPKGSVVKRPARVKMLGNAVVWQQAAVLFEEVVRVEGMS